jgi:hypothetical protein
VTAVAILAALLAILDGGPESPEARMHRFARAAIAIEHVSASQPWLAPALVSTVRAESRGDLDVHAGRRVSSAGAVCLTQIAPGNRLRAWDLPDLVGTDYAATLRCMHVAAVTLVVSRAHCRKQRYLKHWAPAMFSVYVTGGKCWKAKDRFARAATMYRVAGTAWAETDEMRAAIAAVRKEASEHERETTTQATLESAEAQADSDAEAGGSVQGASLPEDASADARAVSGRDAGTARESCARVHRDHQRIRKTARSLRSSGWVPATDRTVAMARWARSLLELPDGEIRIRDFGSREVLARREPHCDEERGWHRGVSLYVRVGS